MEENNNEISLMDIWNRIWKNKFLIIIITAVITIIGTLGLFFMNKSGAKVQTRVLYDFLYVNSSTFADGTRFDYRDLMTEDFLNDVKKSNEDFSGVDIEKLVKNKTSSIIYEKVKKKDTEDIIDTYYEINLPLKYFNNDELLAQAFMKSIHENLLKIATDKSKYLGIHNYFTPDGLIDGEDAIETKDFSKLTYPELFNIFRSQNALLIGDMDSFIGKHPNALVNDVRIMDLKLEYQRWYRDSVNVDNLVTEATLYAYYNTNGLDETKRRSALEITRIERALEKNEETLTQLREEYKELAGDGTLPGDGQDVFRSEIAALIKTNILLNEDLKYHNKIVLIETEQVQHKTPEEQDFDARVYRLTNEFSNLVKHYNNFYQTYYSENTRYIIKEDNEFETIKKFNMPLMVIVFGMLGGIAGVTTALIKQSIKDKEEIETV